MELPFYILLIIFFLAIAGTILICFFIFKGKNKSTHSKYETELKQLQDERSRIEEEKKKTEDKSKKIWQMSETVYKEKKKVDEQVEQLQTEKEKLESEKKKVDEKVKKLWSQSTAIHKEKERINEIKIEIEHKHKEVMDSVNYAKRIQEAILPDKREIAEKLRNSFILFKPRDIVSGDFYWFSYQDGKSIIAAVDCTGHGVPGAFMSMIGNTILNQIVNERGITDPAQILNKLNEEINNALKQTQQDSDSRDGMDLAICSFEESPSGISMCYGGANRPLYYIKEGVLEEIKADKFPIGGLDYDVPKIFTTHTFQMKAGETIYISTDGFADQFSPDDKKLMTRKFKELLVGLQDKPMDEQRNFLDIFIDNWRGNTEQTDDILVIGIKV